jgi:magnesium-protoporphyrin O-methyltransferase
VGCGVGALHLTLLKEGAGSAQGVDLSRGMLDQAAEMSASMNLADRVEYTQGDFVTLNGDISRADVTMLDKVVCCYADAPALIARTAEVTTHTIALSHPRNLWPIRFVWKTQAYFARLFRFSFYPCWHHWPDVALDVERHGFRETYRARTLLWEVGVFRR